MGKKDLRRHNDCIAFLVQLAHAQAPEGNHPMTKGVLWRNSVLELSRLNSNIFNQEIKTKIPDLTGKPGILN